MLALTVRSTWLALAAALLVALPAGEGRANCSPGQMAEAQLQFSGAQSLLQSQQWNDAISQLLSIVEFCPEYFPALRGLGLAYTNTKQFDLAAQAYEKVIKVRGEEAEAFDYANLARVLATQKKYREARAEYLKAKARDPHNCTVLVNLGILHTASEFPEQAVETLEDALTHCPDLSAQILPRLAEAAAKAADRQRQIGNSERASAYRAMADRYGGSAGGATAFEQIRTAMTREDFETAVRLADQLLAREPEAAGAWLNKARAADALGRKNDSVEAYRRYLALRSDDIDETAAMIIVMVEAGDCDGALTAAREANQKFAGMGALALGKINFAHGKALFCKEDFAGARAQFQRAAQSGDAKWANAAREGISACDQHLQYQAAQRQRDAARQGG